MRSQKVIGWEATVEPPWRLHLLAPTNMSSRAASSLVLSLRLRGPSSRLRLLPVLGHGVHSLAGKPQRLHHFKGFHLQTSFLPSNSQYLHVPPQAVKPEARLNEDGSFASEGSDPSKTTIKRPPSSRETMWTVPNIITLARIISSPLLAGLILQGRYSYAVMGLAVAAGSDWLDGHIAKNYNQSSVLGSFLDPLADKVLVAALAVPLALQGFIPTPLLVVVLGRDALLIGGSFIKRLQNRPVGAPFFDTASSATFQITPNLLSKINTTLQFIVLTFALCRALWGDAIPAAVDEVFEPLW